MDHDFPRVAVSQLSNSDCLLIVDVLISMDACPVVVPFDIHMIQEENVWSYVVLLQGTPFWCIHSSHAQSWHSSF